jgi:hypothetical protein
MKQKRLLLFLLLGTGLLLFSGCNVRVTSTVPAVPTPGEPIATTVPQPTPRPPTTPSGPVTPAATQAPPPELANRPEMTVQGMLEGNIPHGVTALGNYFKGDPQAPLIQFEFSDYQ